VFALTGLVSSALLVSLFGLDETSSVLAILAGLLATLVIVIAFGALLNATIEFVAYRRLRQAPRLAVLITAVGMSFIVQNTSLAIFGVNFRSIPPLISEGNVFKIGDVSYQWNQLFAVLATVPILILLTWLVQSTRHGKAMRATSQDTDAAAIMGVNVNRTISFTGGLAGVGGLLYLIEFNIRYDTGFELGLIAFTAAVLGGIGNLSGAVLGALLIGLIQAFNEGLSWLAPGSDWTRSIVFGILIAILVFRPEGLLGERTPEGA
jgi:branched-chain amino acid transport system permease protein